MINVTKIVDGGQGSCLLITEEQSRYGDNARMLLPGQIADDGLCRVITNIKIPANDDFIKKLRPRDNTAFLPTVEDFKMIYREAPYMNTPRILLQAATKLLKSAGHIWCIGEIANIKAQALNQLYHGQVSIMETEYKTSLCVFQISSTDVKRDTICPEFQRDYGPRLIVLPNGNTKLSDALHTFQHLIGVSKLESLNFWQEFHSTCLTRKGVHALCQEAVMCILPDGPQDRQAAFHSIQVTSGEIVEAMCRTVAEYGYSCSSVENMSDEYLLLFSDN